MPDCIDCIGAPAVAKFPPMANAQRPNNKIGWILTAVGSACIILGGAITAGTITGKSSALALLAWAGIFGILLGSIILGVGVGILDTNRHRSRRPN
jgi:hypothetical protein